MPGTREGGLKAAATNKARHGEDFYIKTGAKGGAKSRGGGFAANPELARLAGAKGGKASRRGKNKPFVEENKSTIKSLISKLTNK